MSNSSSDPSTTSSSSSDIMSTSSSDSSIGTMSTSSSDSVSDTSSATTNTIINDLAPESLATVFAYLSPDERVRLERVCRQWRGVARRLGWIGFRKLTLNEDELEDEDDLELEIARYKALLDRCAPFLHELSIPTFWEYNMDQWTKLRNVRHLRFDKCVPSATLCAVTDNLTRLQSVHFRDMDWCSDVGLLDFLRIINPSLQALSIPLSNSALPASLRALRINTCPSHSIIWRGKQKRQNDRIDELLDLAAKCCPRLAILTLPNQFEISAESLAKLIRFESLSFLRLRFDPDYTNVFRSPLARIGEQLRALLLGPIVLRVLPMIANSCPLLEHCSFSLFCSSLAGGEAVFSALNSVFQLAHLRSVSFNYLCLSSLLHEQIFAALNGLLAKGNIEYLHLYRRLPLPVGFIANLLQLNHNMSKLTCAVAPVHTPAELEQLKTLLQSLDRPVELELFNLCPPELKAVANSKVKIRVRTAIGPPESISRPMLRQLWARTMESVPSNDLLGDLDD